MWRVALERVACRLDLSSNNKMSAIMKCDFNGDLRRVSLTETSFIELKRVLAQLYDLTSDFTVKYVDDENDLITMTSDSELVEALNLSKATEQPLRLTIVAKTTATPSADSKADAKRSFFSAEDKAAWREAWLARKTARKAAREERAKERGASAAPSDAEGKDKDEKEKEEDKEGDHRARRHWRKFAKMMMMRRLMGRHGSHRHGFHAMRHFGGGFGAGRLSMMRRRHCHSGSEKGMGMRRHHRMHGRHGFGHGLGPRRLARLAMLAGVKEHHKLFARRHCHGVSLKHGADSLKGRRRRCFGMGSLKGSLKCSRCASFKSSFKGSRCGFFKGSFKGRRCGSLKGSLKGSFKARHCHRRRSPSVERGAHHELPRHFRRMMLLAALKKRMHGSRKEGRMSACGGMRRHHGHGCGSRRAARMFA